MLTWLANASALSCRFAKFGAAAILTLLGAVSALADEAGGEANLKLPDLSQVTFLGIDGHKLLLFGIVICIFGLGFGLTIYSRLKNLPNYAGKVFADPVDFYRRRDRHVLRLARSRASYCGHAADHSDLQPRG